MNINVQELQVLRGALEDRLAVLKLIEDRMPEGAPYSKIRTQTYDLAARIEEEIVAAQKRAAEEQAKLKAEHEAQEAQKREDAKKAAEQGEHLKPVEEVARG